MNFSKIKKILKIFKKVLTIRNFHDIIYTEDKERAAARQEVIMKIKSIKISDYFEIRNPKYEILKLTPIKSNRNTQTDKIAELVNKMHRKTDKLIYKENKKLIIEPQYKFMFYIHIEKHSVKFFAVIPKIYINQFKVKFRETWRNIQIDIVNELSLNLKEAYPVKSFSFSVFNTFSPLLFIT